MPRLRQYARAKARRHCPWCKTPLAPDTHADTVYCLACKGDMLRNYYARQAAQWALPGPNLLAHCGQFWQITALPFILPCCGATYFEEVPHAPLR